MAKADKKEIEVKSTKSLVVRAGSCIKNPEHTQTRVYRTTGRTRYCKCNDCGATWKIVADYSGDLQQYVHQLADDIENAERVKTESGTVVVLSDEQAKGITSDLRDLLELAP